MKEVISSNNYLTEKSLVDLLPKLFPVCEFVPQYRFDVGSSKLRVDCAIFKNNQLWIVVEYDGPLHYRDTKTQRRDESLKVECANQGIRYVSVPYFVQPSNDMLRFVFNYSEYWLHYNLAQTLRGYIDNPFSFDHLVFDWNFPQGFITKSCLRPCDFNIAGWNRFARFIATLKYYFKPLADKLMISLLPNELPEHDSRRVYVDIELP